MFRVIYPFQAENLSLEKNSETGICCLCVPFIGNVVRGGVRFRVSEAEFSLLAVNPEARAEFADKCRQRLCDDRLIEPYLPRNARPCLPGDSEGKPFIQEYHDSRTLMIFIQQWFSVSYNFNRKQYYLGIQCDFSCHAQGSEDYWITAEEYDHLVRHPDEMIELAGKCQRQQNDERWINKGERHGNPWYIPPPEPAAKAESKSESVPESHEVTKVGFLRRLFGLGKAG